MVEWFLQLLRTNENPVPASDPLSEFERQALIEHSGLLITPHLLGTGTPDFDPLASGVIFGLRPSTRGRDLYQGILEGIACEFADTADLLEIASGPFSEVFVTGGGCRSRLGLEMRATLSNRSLHRMECAEAVCLGAAILAGVGAGKYRNISEAVSQLVKVSDTVEPRKDMTALLIGQRKKYQALCATLKDMRAAKAASA